MFEYRGSSYKRTVFLSLSVSDALVLIRDHVDNNFISVPLRTSPHQKTPPPRKEPLTKASTPAVAIWWSQPAWKTQIPQESHSWLSRNQKTYLLYKAHVKFCLYPSVLLWDVTIGCFHGNRGCPMQVDSPLPSSSPAGIPACRDWGLLLSSSRGHEETTSHCTPVAISCPPRPSPSPTPPSTSPQTLRMAWTRRSALWQALQLRLSWVWKAGSPAFWTCHLLSPRPFISHGTQFEKGGISVAGKI